MGNGQGDDSTAGALLLATGGAMYVVNLPHRTDRRAEFERQLRGIGLSFDDPRVVLYPATRPAEAGGFPTVGTRGCFLSHLGVLEAARESGHRAIVVCEDDLDFAPDFAARFPPIAAALRDTPWDIFYAGYGETPRGEPLPGAPGLMEVPSGEPVGCLHFVCFRGAVIEELPGYLRRILGRPPGDPEGGLMHVDGALCWFRAAFPQFRTLAVTPPLGVQRPSRTDIHDLRWFDRSPLTRGLVQSLRRLKRGARLRS